MTARIAVVGDLLLDRDVVGTVSRVCPDAPVPVLDVEQETARPGGAGLAAVLLAAEGHDVTLLAAVGDDPAGRRAAELLGDHGVRLVPLTTPGRTREKVRIRAAGQSLVRIDAGTACHPSGVTGEGVRAVQQAEAVLVSDYAGGMTGASAVRSLLRDVAAAVPVVWDPHPKGAAPVPGVRLATPNLAEASALSGAADGTSHGRADGTSPGRADGTSPGPAQRQPASEALTDAARHGAALRDRWACGAVAVTVGAHGAVLVQGSGAPFVVPAERVAGGDPCGAGDRFAAAAAQALASGALVSAAVQRAVASASAFVANGGAAAVAAPTRQEAGEPASGWRRVEQVRARGGTVVATGGCFDLLHAGHIALLRAARNLGDALVVCLNSDASVRRLKGPGRPLVPEPDRRRVLEALECVDAVVVFEEDTPVAALRRVQPDIWAKGGDYALTDLPEAGVLAEWGGHAVVLPYLDGRSTTALIGAARERATTSGELP